MHFMLFSSFDQVATAHSVQSLMMFYLTAMGFKMTGELFEFVFVFIYICMIVYLSTFHHKLECSM